MLTPLLIALAVGYFLGALPFGYLVARSRGVNIFEEGSKNPGATNVLRVLSAKFGPAGKRLGLLVFFLDGLKGAAATGWPLAWMASGRAGHCTAGDVAYMAVAGLVGALIGHSFSCFTKFKGGKGVATASGGLLVLMPLALLFGAAVWVGVFQVTRYVSLASMLAAASMPVTAYLLGEPALLLGLTGLVALLVVIRHRSNIQRLLNGTESKFVKKTEAKS